MISKATFLCALITSSVFAASCGGAAPEADATRADEDALTAPGGDQCGLVPRSALDPLIAAIDSAEALAAVDVANNGVNGAYAVAAQYNLDGIRSAQSTVEDLRSWLLTGGDNAPEATYYVEGYNIQTGLLTTLSDLTYASHWAAISAVYHLSEEARQSIEYSLTAAELANDIRARGLRCYVNAYFD